MSEKLFLSLDQGGGSSRAMVFTASGQLIASAKMAVSTMRPRAQWVEQDPIEVLSSLQQVAAQVVAQLSSSQRGRLEACALVCQRSSLVCWRSDSGAALSPIISWQDTRASDWLASQSFDHEAIYQCTGLFPNAHFGVSKMRWCLQHYNSVRIAENDGCLRIAPLASYLANQLLDQSPFVVDPANASRTLLMNVESGDWDKSLLVLFAINASFLPEIVSSEFPFGTMTIDGLSLPLTLLTGDQSAAAFANGEPEDRSCYLNMGTGAFIYRPLGTALNEDQLAINVLDRLPDRLLKSVLHWPENSQCPHYIVEGTINGAGSALQWFADNNALDDLPGYLGAVLGDVTLLVNNPFFLNGVGGLGSPDWVANFSSKFIGEGNLKQKFIAIIESIIFLINRNFQLINSDNNTQQMFVSGGLSQSDWICQRLSNLLGVPVIRPAECEATVRGAVFLLAGKPATWPDLDKQSFYPEQEPLLAQRFEQWTELMAQSLLSCDDG